MTDPKLDTLSRAAHDYARAVYAARRQIHHGGAADLRDLDVAIAKASGAMEEIALELWPEQLEQN